MRQIATCSAFEAHVVATDGRAVALDQTAFYPGGGGQMADHGELVWTGAACRWQG